MRHDRGGRRGAWWAQPRRTCKFRRQSHDAATLPERNLAHDHGRALALEQIQCPAVHRGEACDPLAARAYEALPRERIDAAGVF